MFSFFKNRRNKNGNKQQKLLHKNLDSELKNDEEYTELLSKYEDNLQQERVLMETVKGLEEVDSLEKEIIKELLC
ncbi:MAG: hypothetical protein ACLRRH_09860 [Clostridium sp.]